MTTESERIVKEIVLRQEENRVAARKEIEKRELEEKNRNETRELFDKERSKKFIESGIVEIFQQLRDQKIVVESNEPMYEEIRKPVFVEDKKPGLFGIGTIITRVSDSGYNRVKGKIVSEYTPSIVEVRPTEVIIKFNYSCQVRAGIDNKGNYFLMGGKANHNYYGRDSLILGSMDQPLDIEVFVVVLAQMLEEPDSYATSSRKPHWGYVSVSSSSDDDTDWGHAGSHCIGE